MALFIHLFLLWGYFLCCTSVFALFFVLLWHANSIYLLINLSGDTGWYFPPAMVHLCFHDAAYSGIITTRYYWYTDIVLWVLCLGNTDPVCYHRHAVHQDVRVVLCNACTTCVYGGHAVIWSYGHTHHMNLPPRFCSSALHPPTWSGQCNGTCTFLLCPPDASAPNTSWQRRERNKTRGKITDREGGLM